MKQILLTVPFFRILTLLLLHGTSLFGQCPQIEAIMIDACGTEQLNEFVIIHAGGGFNTADIELDFDQNSNTLDTVNNDINSDNGNAPGQPCGITTGNLEVYVGCSNLIAVGSGVNIPANAIVVLQTSASVNTNAYNFTSLCGSGQCVYVVSNACARSTDAFDNAGTGQRITNFSIAGGCNQSISYDRSALGSANGDYYLPLSSAYGNNGCAVPPGVTAPVPPDINPIANITICHNYTLPVITGTNLSPNAAYFTDTNGTGTKYLPGDVISSSMTLYAFDETGGACFDQEQFNITIYPRPIVNPLGNQLACAGKSLIMDFSSPNGSPVYNWTNNNTAIGLPASGTGNISFTAANVIIAQTATITVTPTENGCSGVAETFSIVVSPMPSVAQPGNVTLCGGQSVVVALSGSPGAILSWTNDNPATGLPTSGTGATLQLNTTNVATQQISTITVTPAEGNCTGVPTSFTVTVNPVPIMNAPSNLSVCAEELILVNFSASFANTTYSWVNTNPSIGLPASGSGAINFFAANVSTVQTATITVTPRLGNCNGAPQSFSITVNPTATVNPIANVTACAGDPVAVVINGSAGSSFSWISNNPAIGIPSNGVGNINFTAALVASQQTALVSVSPTLIGGGCPGALEQFSIVVNPVSGIAPIGNQNICVGDAVNINFSTFGSGSTVLWTNDNPNVGLGTNGTGDISFVAANLPSTETATITATSLSEGGYAYITNRFSGTVSVIDISSNTLVATIPVGGRPFGVSTSPDGERVYITKEELPSNGSMIVIDAYTNTVIGSVPMGLNPSGVVCSPDGTNLYVHQGSNNLAVIDAVTLSLLTTIPSAGQGGVVVSPDGSKVYTGGGNVKIIDALSNTIIGVLPVSTSANGLAITPNGQRLYVSNATPSTIASVFDLPSGTLLANVTVGAAPYGIVVSPDGQRVYSANENSNDVSVIDVANNTVIATIPVGIGPIGIDITPDGKWVYVANVGSDHVSVIETATNTMVATVPVDISPMAFGKFIIPKSPCLAPPQTFTITVNSRPELAPTSDILACGDEFVELLFGADPGTLVSWQNSNPAIGLPASGTGNLSFTTANLSTPQTAIITATPSLDACSGAPIQFSIFINPSPTTNILGNLSLCEGESTVLTAFGGTDYAWDNGEMTTSISVAPLNTNTYTVLVSNSAGCTSTATAVVEVNPLPIATIVGSTTLCSGSSASLTASGGNSYIWNTAETSSTISISPTSSSAYTVTVTNASACTSTAEIAVMLLPTDTTNIARTTCDPDLAGISFQNLFNRLGCDSLVVITTTLLPSSSQSISETSCNLNEVGVFTQNLSNQFGCDSTIITTVLFDSGGSDTTALARSTCDFALAGVSMQLLSNHLGCDSLVVTTTTLLPSYSQTFNLLTCDPNAVGVFTQNFTNQYGCDSTVITAVELALEPSVSATASVSTPFNGYALSCSDANDGEIMAIASGGNPPYQFFWSTGEAENSINGLPAGNYALTVVDAKGCTIIADATLESPPLLTLEVQISRADCDDLALDAEVRALGGVAPYILTMDGNTISGTAPALGAGSHLVAVTDANGCLTSKDIDITPPFFPDISLPPDTTLTLGNPLKIEASTNLDIWQNISWNPLPDPMCPSCPIQEWLPENTQLITVTILDTFGCSATAQIQVTVSKDTEIYLPNIFSPNGDGQNDLWKAYPGSAGILLREASVFNRWGEQLYYWDSPLPLHEWPGWDGTFQAHKVPLGVYVYLLKLTMEDGSTKILSGDLTIVSR